MLDDSAADSELAASTFQHAGVAAQVERVDSRDAFARALKAFEPHVVLADHAMPQFTTLEAMDLVREVRPGTPLIVFSGALNEREIVMCLRAGAEDVILKAHVADLPDSVRAAVASRGHVGRLSPRQLQVLRLIADGHTNREIGKRLRVSVKTIETHRTAVMKRLGLHDLASLVRFAVRAGLVSPSR